MNVSIEEIFARVSGGLLAVRLCIDYKADYASDYPLNPKPSTTGREAQEKGLYTYDPTREPGAACRPTWPGCRKSLRV